MRLWLLQIVIVLAGVAFAVLLERMPVLILPGTEQCIAPKTVVQQQQCDELRQRMFKG